MKMPIPEDALPFSFSFVPVWNLCAAVSPLLAAGIVWALRTTRYRNIGQRAGIAAGIFTAKFIATYFILNFLFGNEFQFRPMAIALAGGTGFTAGALIACAWTWMRSARV